MKTVRPDLEERLDAAGVALVALVVAATLLWWRGPEWGSVLDAFDS